MKTGFYLEDSVDLNYEDQLVIKMNNEVDGMESPSTDYVTSNWKTTNDLQKTETFYYILNRLINSEEYNIFDIEERESLKFNFICKIFGAEHPDIYMQYLNYPHSQELLGFNVSQLLSLRKNLKECSQEMVDLKEKYDNLSNQIEMLNDLIFKLK